ncbi:CNNM domain-containing protein [Nonomuraea rubra]|uniref:CNNM domain-containing protein n=1 Tax=Nonomuraea rubra TaxID=46180 RepID=UPI00361A63D9
MSGCWPSCFSPRRPAISSPRSSPSSPPTGALREQAAAGDTSAEKALQVTSRLSFMLSGAQLGITVTALLVGFLAEPAIATLVRPWLAGTGLSDGMITGISVAAGVFVATVVQMVLGELAPKNLGIARPEQVAKFLARSTLIYLAVVGPVVRLFDSAATGLLRRVGVEPVEEVEHGATPEELSRIIAESTQAGELPPRLSDLLERALEFGDRTAEEIMVPAPGWWSCVPRSRSATSSRSCANAATPATPWWARTAT